MIILIVLVLLGLTFGSFVNALVWRIFQQSTNAKKKNHSEDLSILHGRSMCVHCKHMLAWYDLLPLVSWLALRRKCRYCNKAISTQYPLVELATAVLFVLSFVFWPSAFTGVGLYDFIIWLFVSVSLVALFVYDLKFMILPNRIIYPAIVLSVVALLGRSAVFQPRGSGIVSTLLAVLVGGGVFYVLFQLSQGKWIGGGDVKLGVLMGLILMNPSLTFLTIFLASLMGTIVAMPLIIFGKAKMSSKLPFGPFLIVSFYVSKLFGTAIIRWYMVKFVLV